MVAKKVCQGKKNIRGFFPFEFPDNPGKLVREYRQPGHDGLPSLT